MPTPSLDHALEAAGTDEARSRILTEHYLATMRDEPHGWIVALADVVDRHGLSTHVLRRTVSGLSWQARDLGLSVPGDDVLAIGPAGTASQTRALALAYAQTYRLRFDFKFAQLEARTRQWRRSFGEDALLRSVAAFAALGNGSPQASELLDGIEQLPDYDSSCRWICLHGLWLAAGTPEHAERALKLSHDIVRAGDENANVYYWRAGVLRQLGRFTDALVSIDLAIDLLEPGSNSVHQDYLRERELVLAGIATEARIRAVAQEVRQELEARSEDKLAEATQDIERQHETARRLVSESLLGVIEVLAIFVTLATFLVGSGTVLRSANGYWQNFAAVGLLLAGSAVLFWLLRVIVQPPTRGVDGAVRALRRWSRR